MTVTRGAFIAAYRDRVTQGNPVWLQHNPSQLERFMEAVTETLSTPRTLWPWDGPTAKAAWKAIGGKGKLTLKALRALPLEQPKV